MTDDNKKNQGDRVGKEDNKDAGVKADPETLHTTDPQDEMKGPVSSLMQNISHAAQDEVSKEEADREKEKDM